MTATYNITQVSFPVDHITALHLGASGFSFETQMYIVRHRQMEQSNHHTRGEYFSKNFYFCTTPKNGPAQESSYAWEPDGNIFARLQKSAFLARLKALFLHNSKGNSLNLHDII